MNKKGEVLLCEFPLFPRIGFSYAGENEKNQKIIKNTARKQKILVFVKQICYYIPINLRWGDVNECTVIR